MLVEDKKDHAVKATMWTRVNILAFLDKDKQLLGFQIHQATLDKLKLVPSNANKIYPSNTAKTLKVDDVHVSIDYGKKKINDEEAVLISFRINDAHNYLINKIKSQVDKAVDITTNEDTRDDIDGEHHCLAFAPTHEAYALSYSCILCSNKSHCMK